MSAFREANAWCMWCGKVGATIQLPNGRWVHDACAPTFHQKLGETFRRARRSEVIADLLRVALGVIRDTTRGLPAKVVLLVISTAASGLFFAKLATCAANGPSGCSLGEELWQPTSGTITQKIYEPAWVERWVDHDCIYVAVSENVSVPVCTDTPRSREHPERFIIVIEGCFANVCKTHAWEVSKEDYDHAETHAPWPTTRSS